MKMNASMRSMVASLDGWQLQILSPEIEQLVRATIVKENDCYFLQPLRDAVRSSTLDEFPDRTGFECFVNHFHVRDFIDAEAREPILAQTLLAVEVLRNRLATIGDFNIIANFDESDCTIRFHLRRSGETWIDEDLDAYKEEPILLVRTSFADR